MYHSQNYLKGFFPSQVLGNQNSKISFTVILIFLLLLVLNGELTGGAFRNGRRTCLPAPCPDTSNINLWNILRNNIGKDLSKVSMPVELNEPLNTLQHLCEEMEYSELLDKASETDSPYERMVINSRAAPFGFANPRPGLGKIH